MKISYLPFENIPFFSKRDKAFQAGNENLMSFIPYSPSLEDFKDAIIERRNYSIDRSLLTSSIYEQYKSIGMSDLQKRNLYALESDNVFTVTTAHQPSLFTGPFYFILKICSTINLAQRLSNAQISQIVPIFIIGGEDHDFEEINHTHIFGKKITWERNSAGAVGRLDLKGFRDQVVDSLIALLGKSENAETLKKLIITSINSANTYGEFTFNLVNHLFAQYGLLVVSFDQPSFKKHFIPVIKKEIIESISIQAVESTQKKIISKGFKKQAHARDINFFYFTDNKRLRIERVNNDTFKVLGSTMRFSKSEMVKEIETHPERFSPNVIMRPIFQERILPNIAYIGGGGELGYWMERFSQFQLLNTFYPVLIRRNSAMYITKRQWDTMKKLSLNITDLMKNEDSLIKEYVKNNTKHSVSLQKSKDEIKSTYFNLLQNTNQIDKSLEGKVKALQTQQLKELDKLEQRLIKKLKSNQEITINKICKLKNQLFPNNGLQERKINFMEFYLREGDSFIPRLIETCNPLKTNFTVLAEE